MQKLFAVALLLVSASASATRTERAIQGLPGQARIFYDSTARSVGFEVEQTDQLWVTRHGFDGRSLGYHLDEEFNEGAAKGLAIAQVDSTAFDGATGALNLLYLDHGNVLAAVPLGAGQTLSPAMVAAGLDIGGDQTADEGYELVSHVWGATGKPLVIGTTPAFYFQVTVTTGDISGTDDLHCGLRKVEPTNSAFDSYTDFVSLGVNAAANPGAVKIETGLNSAATTSTDTTDTIADGVALTMKFLVSAAGVVTYQDDAATTGTMAAPTVTAAFTFDDGDLVIPFCWFLNDTALADSVVVSDWTVDLQ